uniref:cellulose 1,4-beta-cellobiosidase (non-reducing end) n=1 Tax=Albugo laibachii Nc14 TaxID=890382 RepID=F0WK83_9STRA|nr:exoglucanase 1 putative [Albugo laibachii Nc14]|eukprot:CCA21686.1 exoglucanase 1 putative [Albugo laibachii Nc14]
MTPHLARSFQLQNHPITTVRHHPPSIFQPVIALFRVVDTGLRSWIKHTHTFAIDILWKEAIAIMPFSLLNFHSASQLAMVSRVALVLAGFLRTSQTQQPGTLQPEKHPVLVTQECTSTQCKPVSDTQITLDANWRWLHESKGYTNCYTGNSWNPTFCSDPKTCSENCALEGVNYAETYGITVKEDQLKLSFVTKHAYGTNVGSRVYLMESETAYKNFELLNQEFTFDVDISKLPCGLNGALYFSEMDMDGGMKRSNGTNKAGAMYGTGYCDAQCPHDIKFIDGEANVLDWKTTNENSGNGRYGSCCSEMDIWEANSMSNAYTSHPCSIPSGLQRCGGAEQCGDTTAGRYSGLCDKDGCDFNPFRLGTQNFYGPGSQFKIDSTRTFTVVTQFHTSDQTADGDLVDIRRVYYQDGKEYISPNISIPGVDPFGSITDEMCSQVKGAFKDTNDHEKKGGLKRMGDSMRRGMVLAMSIWVDYAAQCLWLDSTYPTDADQSKPGAQRGTCPTSSGKPEDVIRSHPDASVAFSNIRIGEIGSTVECEV